jgi:hypothetical protein
MIKKIYLFIILLCAAFSIFAQDIIIKNDKTEFKAKVLEVLDVEVKYKKWEMQDGLKKLLL